MFSFYVFMTAVFACLATFFGDGISVLGNNIGQIFSLTHGATVGGAVVSGLCAIREGFIEALILTKKSKDRQAKDER